MQHRSWGDFSDQSHRRQPLIEVPVCAALVLSLAWLMPYFVMALKDNLRANPEGWRGVIPLGIIMGSAVFLVVLACAGAAALLGLGLQFVFGRRTAARSRGV